MLQGPSVDRPTQREPLRQPGTENSRLQQGLRLTSQAWDWRSSAHRPAWVSSRWPTECRKWSSPSSGPARERQDAPAESRFRPSRRRSVDSPCRCLARPALAALLRRNRCDCRPATMFERWSVRIPDSGGGPRQSRNAWPRNLGYDVVSIAVGSAARKTVDQATSLAVGVEVHRLLSFKLPFTDGCRLWC